MSIAQVGRTGLLWALVLLLAAPPGLMAQGPDAPGGAYDYVVKDRMIGGFALVAYPAQYGVSGVMTFIVNQDGIVHEKDLGLDHARSSLAQWGETVAAR